MRWREDGLAVKALVGAMDQKREGAPHVSELVYCVRRAWIRRHRSSELPESTPEDIAQWSRGLAWQGLVEALLARMGWQQQSPEPQEREGIQFQPDAIVHEREGTTVWELKDTKYSAKKTPDDMPTYVAQLKSYCALLGVTRGRLLIKHLLGAYEKGVASAPAWKEWLLEWNRQELDAHLDDLRRRRDQLNSDTLPPPEPAAEWLCRGCREGELVNCTLWRKGDRS